MERLTNNYGDVHEEVKKELLSFDIAKNEECIMYYLEMPWFPGGQFSLFLLRDILTNHYKVIEKMWDGVNDHKRFSTGVYNLDRLCIKIKITELSNQNRQQLENIISDIRYIPSTINRDGYIVLDGVEYELNIKTKTFEKNYKWRIANENLEYFAPLIDFVTTQIQ